MPEKNKDNINNAESEREQRIRQLSQKYMFKRAIYLLMVLRKCYNNEDKSITRDEILNNPKFGNSESYKRKLMTTLRKEGLITWKGGKRTEVNLTQLGFQLTTHMMRPALRDNELGNLSDLFDVLS